MALVVKDRVQETSTTTGTGTLTLDGAVVGYQTFSSSIGNTNITYYAITLGSEWEVGIGTVGAGTLTRSVILESSNGGSAVNFSAGTKNVFCTYPAEKAIYEDDAGRVGIGTDNPTNVLDVVATEPFVKASTSTSGLSAFYQATNPQGNLYLGKDRDGSAGLFGSAGEYVIAGTGNYPMDFWTNTNKRMTISGSGGLSFGSTGTAYGTTGQVLTSNGNAVPTWADASGPVANGTIYENALTISANYTITTSKNGFSVGPITINSGVSVTVPSGSRWVVL